jgi:cation:H+ antiporter
MLLVAAAVSFEELPRMPLPAWRGHPEVSVGNILGTIVFFVLFNVGVIALLRPLPVDRAAVVFHWPFLMGTLLVMSIFLWRRRLGRVAGSVLLAGYVLYLVLSLGGGFGLPVGG